MADIFNRTEKKYIITLKQFNSLKRKLEGYLEEDSFNKANGLYSIHNLYFDTDDNYLIKNSLSKPNYKEKLRLRSYGLPALSDYAYLEIKKKFNGKVNKRRTTIVLSEAYDYIYNDISPKSTDIMNSQIFTEIDYVKHFYNLKPKVVLSYDRQAFFSKEDPSLRLTFDTHIRARRENLRLEVDEGNTSILSDDFYLMEIKVGNSMPLWLCHMLSEEAIYTQSFSKYGTEYQLMLNKLYERKGLRPCLTQYSNQ